MVIHVNCLGRAEPGDLTAVLPALAEAVNGSEVDPARLSVVLDWVQYRKNFREPVVVRPFTAARGNGEPPAGEIAIDVRRIAESDLTHSVQEAIRFLADSSNGARPAERASRLYLEKPTRPSSSVIWSFNRSYWEHLSAWEETFKKDYLAALPGGVSDGMHPDFWRDRIGTFVSVLERLEERATLPEEIYALELGVGSGQQARVWLDTFLALCEERGRLHFYERLHYLMTDYSHDVLATARRAVGPHVEHVSHLDIDFQNPLEALAHLRYKVLFVHSCNLYDNLPTDEVIRVDGRAFEPIVRAYVETASVGAICDEYEIPEHDFADTIHRVLRFGPGVLGDEKTGVQFWARVWEAIRLEEVYTEIADPSAVRLAPSADVRLSDVLMSLPDFTRVHLSSVALESFANTLTLLHPQGVFQVLDLFVRDVAQYSSFRGPGKLDGSIVNWLNGLLFQVLGERLGFHVSLEPFPYREGSNTVVLSTTPKD